MIAEVAVHPVPSRRWWLAVSLAVHALAITAAAIAPRLAVARIDRPSNCVSVGVMSPPPAPDRGQCIAWEQSADVVRCAAWRYPTHDMVSCPAPPTLRAPPPVVSTIVPRDVLVRIAPTDPPSPPGLRHALWVDHVRTGHAVLEVCIDGGGAVTWATPVRSIGYPCFDRALALAALDWRYRPIGGSACGQVTVSFDAD